MFTRLRAVAIRCFGVPPSAFIFTSKSVADVVHRFAFITYGCTGATYNIHTQLEVLGIRAALQRDELEGNKVQG